jgi:hypothetical protein
MVLIETKGVKRMKKYGSIIYILSLAFACLIVAGCATQPGAASAPPPNSGHVLIYRVANFGEDLALVVSVDGKDVGSFTEGGNYSGYLPAGQHRLTVRVDPNRTGAGPGRKTVNVTVRTNVLLHRSLVWRKLEVGKEPLNRKV